MMGLKAEDSMGQAVVSFFGLPVGEPVFASAHFRNRALGAAEKIEIRERIWLGGTKSMGRARQKRRQKYRRPQRRGLRSPQNY